MRILVIGGGIAGTAAALAMHKAGIESTVYEAHPDSGLDHGAFLTLASNGMRALRQIGAAAAVARTGFPLTTMRVVDESGAELAVTPLGEHDDPLTRYRCLRRAELVAALQAEVRDRGIALRHGKRLRSATADDTGVTAEFDDGETARGDLLIGADGLNSVVRSIVDPEAPPPRYAGQRVFYGYTADAAVSLAPEWIEMVRGSATAFGHAVSPDHETYWFARVPGPELDPDEIAGTTPRQWREYLVPLLRRDATAAADIVAATGARLMATHARDLPTVTRWRGPRTLIIGDAAHAASPATGQGASMALEDAVILAKALRDLPSLDEALDVYEELRRPRVSSNIENSARMTTSRMPNRVRRMVRNSSAKRRYARREQASGADELAGQLDWDTPIG
jgi:2-polyprenyl-6-methoxyphenol hydroxylase-like FAD-dependent oxidoreductase